MADVTRWNPFDELAAWRPRDLFAWLRNGEGSMGVEWSPRCDVTESDGTIVVHAELPGVEAKDIDVTVDGRNLVVRGEKCSEMKEDKEGRTYSERFFGSFQRSIALPEGVDTGKIEATTKDGVLEVRVPRPAAAKPEARKIAIKAG